jgi:hypothetical protein
MLRFIFWWKCRATGYWDAPVDWFLSFFWIRYRLADGTESARRCIWSGYHFVGMNGGPGLERGVSLVN